jgi:uncharacterized RDD family membrane protein YckC
LPQQHEPAEAQSDSYQEVYFDPEAPDSSEQEFSASLQQQTARSAFVLQPEDLDPFVGTSSGEQGSNLRAAANASETARAGVGETETGPASADENTHEQFAEESSGSSSSGTDWRDLVSDKVRKYKSRKPRQERYPSLQLQFDSPVAWSPGPSRSAAESGTPSAAPRRLPKQTVDAEPRTLFQATTEATARVLEFPRPGMLPCNRDELAEAVVDRPRIVEAPELVPPPALGGILIESVRAPEPESGPDLELPLQTASVSRRMFAAAVDVILVAAGFAIFAYIFFRFNAAFPPVRESAIMGGFLLAILWPSYQISFLACCGTTPGMVAARLKLRRFNGDPSPKHLRRWRACAALLSGISLGLGYIWCFLDEDQLCWHDRITRTHLSPQ